MTPIPKPSLRSRPGALRRLSAALLCTMIAVGTSLVGGLPVRAELGDAGQVTVDKTANEVNDLTGVERGDTFSYSILVGCDDNPCVDAALTDTLPPEFAGFAIDSLTVSPATTPPTASATLTGCGVGGQVTASCVLDVAFIAPLGSVGGVSYVGIDAGDTYRITVTLTVPADLDPLWPSNGQAVTNTAHGTASNSTPAHDTANVTVSVPIEVDVGSSKAWSTDLQQYNPGQEVSFNIGGSNASNVPADGLVLEDPIDAVDDATTLAVDNPFNFVDYAGLCAPSVLPAGADRVQVDLYAFDTGTSTWSWAVGVPGPTAVAPTVAGAVGGVRFTYTSTTGATIAAGGSGAQQCVMTTQRATHRTSGASFVLGTSVPNSVQATITVPGQPPATDQSSDTLQITGLNVVVEPGKTITPASIPASATFNVQLTARNGSNGPLDTLTITEPASGSFLSDELVFDTFTSWTWPTGATGGTFVWTTTSGSSAPITLTPDGGPPAVPVAPPTITGFVATYTGAIISGTSAGIAFDVDTDPTMIDPPPAVNSENFVNQVGVSGTNPAGTDTETAQDDVTVYYPEIDLTIDKTVRPDLVTPGGTVVAELHTQTAANLPVVDPTQIVVEDVWDGDTGDFWDAFRARSISFTDVPSGSTMMVQYATGTPPALTWTTFATGVTGLYSADFGAIGDSIVGLRFTFDNPAGFAQGTIVQPNVVFEASDTLRTGGPTAVPGDPSVPVSYENVATAKGTGDAGGVPVTSPLVTDRDSTDIITYGSGPGPGTMLSGKRWVTSNYSTDLTTVLSQSGSAAYTRHSWGVTVPGYTSVVLSDALPGQEVTPAATTFQAFDLHAIRAVSYAEDPLLRWDQISSVELYLGGSWNGTAWVGGSWALVPAPGGSWMDGAGFKGYTLSATEAQQATGVRVTVVENGPARAASTTPGRPAPGSGVAWSATGRLFGLEWQLRNVLRVPSTAPANTWVTQDVTYNASAGDVINRFRVAGTTPTTTVNRDSSDNILLQDTPPGVDATKMVEPTSVIVPFPGDVPAASYPTVNVTINAWNTASARASYVRVVDPVPCATLAACVTPASNRSPDLFTGNTYSPTTNPFEQFNLTGVDFDVPGAVPIDPEATQVALWHYNPETAFTWVTPHTMEALDTMAAGALADVVGVGIVYQSTDPATTGGLIPQGTSSGTNNIRMVLHTQLRPTLRSSGANTVGGVEVDNDIVAQAFDPVLEPLGTPNASDDARIQLLVPGLAVTASKSIAPTSILETSPTTPITVTLGATDGASTVAAETATIIDTDVDFWDAFALTSLGAVTRPAGADLVRVDVQVDDDDATWIEGVAAATAALPASVTDLSTVTGIRFVFSNDPTRPFSATVPSADWSAQAQLTMVLRDGATFPSRIENTIRTEATHRGYPGVDAAATAGVDLTTGTPRIDVRKDLQAGGSNIVEPGVSELWTLTFRNTGTSFITVNQVIDDLGPSLRWDGEPPSYDSVGLLPTTDITVTQSSATNLTFTFPTGSRMAPDDTFTITVGIILQPGLTGTERATNGFVVDTNSTFAAGACTNTSGNGQGTIPGLPANQCGTTNYVRPQAGPLLLAVKSVRGEINDDVVDGATNVVNPALPCTPDSDGFYRTVCAAHTTIGGTDEWKVGGVNTGTVAFTRVTVVDALPVPGDRMLATGAARGSQWRPVFDLDYGVVADGLPDGSTYTVEVTTAPAPCVGAGPTSTWPTDPTCSNSPPPADWALLSAFTGEAEDITGLRIVADYTAAQLSVLPPGGLATFRYRTINVPRVGVTPTDTAVLPVLWTGATTQRAWNQVGVTAVLASGGTISRAPERTGVQLLTGALVVEKTTSGAADAYAPAHVSFDVECTVPDGLGGPPVDVDLGTSATLSVPTNDTARIDGIPLGASCTVTETGALGDFGEVARTPATPQVVEITTAGDPSSTVPAMQSVTFDNRYDFADVEVRKSIEEQTNPPVAFGPWGFTITCTAPFPTPAVVLDEQFTLDLAPDVYDAPADTIPVHSTCVVTELTPSADTSFAGTGVTDNGDGTADLEVDASAVLTATNRYSVGTLEVEKVQIGAGVTRYGGGPFVVAATCTYGSPATEIYRGSVTLTAANGFHARFQSGGSDAWLPAGADCRLSETSTAGATSAPAFQPSSTVQIVGGTPGGVPPAAPVLVTVTNTFDTGQISVQKQITGAGAERFGAGPFIVRVECTYDRDGTPTYITWNGQPYLDIELNAANLYRSTVDDLLVGARCEVTAETTTGGATTVVLGTAVTVPATAGTPVVITVTNTFEAGNLAIIKLRTGDGAAELGAGPFSARVTCTATVDGVVVPVPIANQGDVVLSAANGYRATVELLPVGATCAVVETDSGGADGVTYEPATGVVSIVAPPTVASVTIVNRFDPPEVQPPPPSPTTPPGGGQLPSTGSDLGVQRLLLAFGAFLLGTGLVLVTTRRRTSTTST